MVSVALVVRLVAKPGKLAELEEFLVSAEPIATRELFTPVWFAFRGEGNVYYIVDAFNSNADRSKHLTGEIALALMAKTPELLAEPPKLEKVDIIGLKLPG